MHKRLQVIYKESHSIKTRGTLPLLPWSNFLQFKDDEVGLSGCLCLVLLSLVLSCIVGYFLRRQKAFGGRDHGTCNDSNIMPGT